MSDIRFTDNQSYIGIGSGIRLFEESWYAKEMSCTIKGFRALCKGLKVPRLKIGKTWYVELTSFQLAIRYISRLGQDDYIFPSRGSKGTEIDILDFQKNIKTLVFELLATQKLQSGKLLETTKEAAKMAAKRLTALGMQYIPESGKREFSKYANEAAGEMPKEMVDWMHDIE